MKGATGATREAAAEEEDLLQRSTKRSNESHEGTPPLVRVANAASAYLREPERSYRDTVMGDTSHHQRAQEEEVDDEGNTSDDGVIEEGDKVSWFRMGMTKEEKIEARRPWRSSLIIKLIGRTIVYQYIWKRIQGMWKMQAEPVLI